MSSERGKLFRHRRRQEKAPYFLVETGEFRGTLTSISRTVDLLGITPERERILLCKASLNTFWSLYMGQKFLKATEPTFGTGIRYNYVVQVICWFLRIICGQFKLRTSA